MITKKELTIKNISIVTAVAVLYVFAIWLIVKSASIPLVQWFSMGVISAVFLCIGINENKLHKDKIVLNIVFVIFIAAGGWATFGLMCAGLALGTLRRNIYNIIFAIAGIIFLYLNDRPMHF
jgi:hypothetical protein